MSKPLKDPNDAPTPDNQDHIDFKKVIAVGVVSLSLFALCSWWAYAILHSERAQLAKRGETTHPTQLGKPEIGIVDQVPFEGDKRLDVWKKEQHERLHGYGWVDAKRGIIHIPIEQAMAEIVAGGAPPAPTKAETGGAK